MTDNQLPVGASLPESMGSPRYWGPAMAHDSLDMDSVDGDRGLVTILEDAVRER
ncbi:MAG: hypothetical protein OXH68_20345 [Gammaproteobacteria bacterium]|nr:hypothetical protein [Gammaproteobacteria bacterium]